jgi:hypothetical protein
VETSGNVIGILSTAVDNVERPWDVSDAIVDTPENSIGMEPTFVEKEERP